MTLPAQPFFFASALTQPAWLWPFSQLTIARIFFSKKMIEKLFKCKQMIHFWNLEWISLEVRLARFSLKTWICEFDIFEQKSSIQTDFQPLKQQNRRKLLKNAQKLDFLELCPVWQRLAGNLPFLPRGPDKKSGLAMVKCFRCNSFWVISNCKSNQICEKTWMKLWSTRDSKIMVRNTFYWH